MVLFAGALLNSKPNILEGLQILINSMLHWENLTAGNMGGQMKTHANSSKCFCLDLNIGEVALQVNENV